MLTTKQKPESPSVDVLLKYQKINFHRLHRTTGYARQHLTRVMQTGEGYSDACARAIAVALGVDMGDLVSYLESKRANK